MAKTGTDNVSYNLVSVLYHALQAAETHDKYLQDAQGDQEAQQFFRQVQEEDRKRAEQAKQLLGRRLAGGAQGMKAAAGDKPTTLGTGAEGAGGGTTGGRR